MALSRAGAENPRISPVGHRPPPAHPRVALTVLDEDDWSRHISLLGRVASLAEDRDLRDVDRLPVYTGRPPLVARWSTYGAERTQTKASAGKRNGPETRWLLANRC